MNEQLTSVTVVYIQTAHYYNKGNSVEGVDMSSQKA